MRPITRPLMIYDGDCRFCRRWIVRWREMTGDRVDYVPYQEVVDEFPEIGGERFRKAVHYLEPSGEVFEGAEAVFRVLAHAPGKQWATRAYEWIPGFALLSEAVYRFVARHRGGLSALTTAVWGQDLQRPTYQRSRGLFVRCLGLVYLIAFTSLWVQLNGLIGKAGIVPATDYLTAVEQHLGAARFHRLPTWCWINSSDAFLHSLCGLGCAFSVVVILGILQGPSLLFLWTAYLSLVGVGQDFLSFQWDMLLLETGFLAVFVAPWGLRSWRATQSPMANTFLTLVRWLLFRLMFLSGITKLTFHDSTWWNLTALNHHYETQPLPTRIGWLAHQLPQGFHMSACIVMFIVELFFPFLIFGPRRLKQIAFVALAGFQVLIALTGNYGFFNVLTLALCIPLLDDSFLNRARFKVVDRVLGRSVALDPKPSLPKAKRVGSELGRRLFITPLVVVILLAGSLEGWEEMWGRNSLSPNLSTALNYLRPFRSVNGYGLFRVMTTERPEIVIEGSDDRVAWQAYGFRWKPGDLSHPPRWCSPHQPRLDWQMWFAALSAPNRPAWFMGLSRQLLEGSPAVRALLENDPFPETPPRYVRAMRYRYRFTDWNERLTTGEWWKRELLGIYLSPVRLPESSNSILRGGHPAGTLARGRQVPVAPTRRAETLRLSSPDRLKKGCDRVFLTGRIDWLPRG